MTTQQSLTVSILLVAVLGIVPLGAQEYRDQIVIEQRVESNVSIQEIGPDKTRYELAGGTEVEVDSWKVEALLFANAPRSYIFAWRQFESGKFAAALSALDLVDAEGSMGTPNGTNVLPIYIKYFRAEALARRKPTADLKRSVAFLEKILSDRLLDETHFGWRARVDYAKRLTLLGEFDRASQAWSAISQDSALQSLSGSVADQIQFEVTLGQAEAFAGRGDWPAAIAAYESALGPAQELGSNAVSAARIGLAQALVAEGNLDRVRTEFSHTQKLARNGIPAEEPERQEIANGLVAMAMVHLADRKFSASQENLARVSVDFGAHQEAHAASLYWAAVLHQAMDRHYREKAGQERSVPKREPILGQAERAKVLAKIYTNTLLTRYPRSRWSDRYRAGLTNPLE